MDGQRSGVPRSASPAGAVQARKAALARRGRGSGRASRHQPLPAGFAALWVTVVIDLVGFGMVLPILPLYAKRFHATSLQAALLVAAFSAASLVSSPLWGRVSDRVGRKPVLVVSLVGTAAGSVLTGLAGGLFLLFVGRLIDGASGASVAVARAAAADLAPPGERTRLFGYLGAAFGVGFVLGPALGGIATVAGPRTPFLLAGAIATVNTVVAVVRLPRLRRHPSGRPAGGRFRPERPTVALIGAAFSAMVAFSAFEATFALFGQHRLGLGLGSAAGVFAGVGVILVVVQGGVVRRVVARLGERTTLCAGLGLDAAGLALLGVARSWAPAAPALLMLTFGEGLVQTTLSSLVAGLARADQRGQALGWQHAAGALARVAGPAIGGALLGTTGSGLPYLTGAALSVVAGVAVALAIPSSRSRPIGSGSAARA